MDVGSWFRPTVARLRSWLRPRRPTLAPAAKTSPLPDGLRVYAIGDVHGFADLFDRLGRAIADDMARDPPKRAFAVLMGDYIDRGPDSAGVIDRLVRRDFPVPFVALRGNHEAMLLEALEGREAMNAWCGSGGIETLRSYGVDPGRGGTKARAKARTRFVERLPASHRAFLDATKLSYSVGGYFFAHAGARPGVPLDRQEAADLLWIREPFLGSAHDFGKVVVHGHTPRQRPEDTPHRINVDTGAFKWGVLTAVALEGGERRFLDSRSAGPT